MQEEIQAAHKQDATYGETTFGRRDQQHGIQEDIQAAHKQDITYGETTFGRRDQQAIM